MIIRTLLTTFVVSLAFSLERISAASLEALVQEEATAVFGAELPETGQFKINFRSGTPTNVSYIRDFLMDKPSGKFVLIARNEDGDFGKFRGSAVLVVSTPVPTRRLLPGDRILKGDLTEILLPFLRVKGRAVLEKGNLEGKQVVRVLEKGKPIAFRSISNPLAVKRGSRVTILYQQGGLILSAPGKALNDAEKDAEVRVVNLASNRTLIAIAIDQGIVEIK